MDFYNRLLAEKLGGDSSKGDELFKLLVGDTLTKVTAEMLDGITELVEDNFWDCNLLTSVTIPNSVTKISNAFGSCDVLASVEIPNSVTSIGDWCFWKCPSMTNITIPSSVTSIGENVFKSCSSLKSVTVLPTTPPTLRSNAFTNTHSSLKIYVPSASVNAYKAATNWSSYKSKIYAI